MDEDTNRRAANRRAEMYECAWRLMFALGENTIQEESSMRTILTRHDVLLEQELLLNALDKMVLKVDRRDATRTIYADLRDDQKVV